MPSPVGRQCLKRSSPERDTVEYLKTVNSCTYEDDCVSSIELTLLPPFKKKVCFHIFLLVPSFLGTPEEDAQQ